MICVHCKTGDPTSGCRTVTFDREGVTIVIRNVPARICPQCGEQYLEAHTTDRLLE
jgi:YgiT-type zinc finger domain-containing protein